MKKKSKNIKMTFVIISAVVIIMVLTIISTIDKNNSQDQVSNTLTDSGDLQIIKSEITETAKFYPFVSNNTYMEIIAVRATDGSVRTALNTCQVCYNSGRGYYEQKGDILICNNCGNQFTIDQIEIIKGGCNPVPILEDMKIENDEIVTVKAEALVPYEPLFANWKR